MNQEEIKKKIRDNLIQANFNVEDLRVQPDLFMGWRIAVISSNFVNQSYDRRKQIVLQGLEDLTIEWLDLLTPQEREWSGKLPLDSNLENLPLWPEALARSAEIPENIVFPSDLDDDLERPIIATFYSLRGGVGRSTALAYTARILARRGRTVLCLDMDLEAPGLTTLFGKEQEIREDQGLLSILVDLDQGNQPNIQDHIIRVSETEELYCLPAGLPNANYARLLTLINTEAWYREETNPLRILINLLSTHLSFKPDVILLDARTGLSSFNAPLLFDLADLAIIVFFPHPQSEIGTKALVRALLSSQTQREIQQKLTPEPRFLVSPIPISKAPEVIERYQNRSLDWISDWLSECNQKRTEGEQMIASEITQFIPYREAIATSDQTVLDREIWQDFEAVSDWLERFIPTRNEQRNEQRLLENDISIAESKLTILKELNFSAGTAENQADFLENFVATELVNRALEPKTPLVLGRKGTGKTAIFRRIQEGRQRPSIVVISPSSLKRNNFWVISPDGFKEIEKTLIETQGSWREFWILQTSLACYLSDAETEKILPDPALSSLIPETLVTELDIIRCLQQMLRISGVGILARNWLECLDRSSQMETILLYDGLDTGFGNTDLDRIRRKQSIEGLLSLIIDMGDNLSYLRFKVLLRDDIWRKLAFENKSHFYGRMVTLTWEEQADFFKIVIKQALRSPTFQQLTKSILGQQLLNNYDYWMETQVFEVWNLLVGDRMKGGKSTFTRTWVWKRLTDGSDNRNPRSLLQLFVTAKEWEEREQKRNPYEKTIIRPRALISSLEKVSQQALDALIQEEFPELKPLITALKMIGRSPVNSDEIQDSDETLKLAIEVGLLSVYDEQKSGILRYKVPDLYLYGIGMTRKGQA
ncbi:MAG TPA: AAA family ATPase [Candidatus Obscuribacterales bacterium]